MGFFSKEEREFRAQTRKNIKEIKDQVKAEKKAEKEQKKQQAKANKGK